MAKQRRALPGDEPKPKRKKTTRKRKPKAKLVWKYLVFTDLHVNANTLERALFILHRVGKLAKEHDATIVCLGDFWDLRGTLNVRQVDEVLTVLREWGKAIFIPGNHDQVSTDGSIHGMNIFEAFPDFTVVTEPLLLDDDKIAFLPWREDDQEPLFAAVPDDSWTIFAHAEVEGAAANGGYTSDGKVAQGTIEAHSRACYVGHYHKRQKLGDRIWYIGSPFEMNFGEREWPHGVALIDNTKAEPTFIECDDLPKHHRLEWGGSMVLPDGASAEDFIEMRVPADQLVSPEFKLWSKSMRKNMGPKFRVTAVSVEQEKNAPAFALTLDEAVEAYVGEHGDVAAKDDLINLGREILAEIPEAAARMSLGKNVRVLEVRTQDFCALRGPLTIPYDDFDFTLLRGPIKTGKTAVADAVMWCLYGATTPRKAGQSGATLRADDVIHDDADSCEVGVVLDVDDARVVVTRTKKRGSGAELHADGVPVKTGISDTQELVNHIVGLDHSLWRACVSLGQGAVANFATDAHKRRTELLSTPFGLAVCPKALKAVKDRLKDLRAAQSDSEHTRTVASTQLEVLREQDLSVQAKAWDEEKRVALSVFAEQISESEVSVAQCVEVMKGEQQWLDSKAQHDAHIDSVTRQLSGLSTSKRIAELQKQYGALEAEKLIVERDIGLDQQKLSALIDAKNAGAATCPECGQPLQEGVDEQHIDGLEARMRSHTVEAQSFQSRLVNVATELDALNSGHAAEAETLRKSIEDSRESLRTVGDALSQFTRVRANMQAAQDQLDKVRNDMAARNRSANPFVVKMAENAEQIEALEKQLTELDDDTAGLDFQVDNLEFWERGFSAKGIPVLVLRTVLYELETHANRFLSQLTDDLHCRLFMEGEDLQIKYYETTGTEVRERTYEKLSGGQRRCVELAFAPFALSELIFNRCGVRVDNLIVDELTTHLGQEEKQRACELLQSLDRKVLVIDHDAAVQGHFDKIVDLKRTSKGMVLS
jgi:DNA repair exonuclease SbcCD ATPase subunit